MLKTHASRFALISFIGVVLAAATITPAAASAATPRYASPGGSGTACSSATPCAINQAITAASTGDEVIVEPGDYMLTATLQTPSSITVHGVAGQLRPRLTFSGAGQNGLGVVGSTLRDVEVDQAADTTALLAANAIVDETVATGGNAGFSSDTASIQNSTILNSVVVASEPTGTAISTEVNGASDSSTYRNVTAIATGSSGVAISAGANGAAGNATIHATNVIADAGASGFAVKAAVYAVGAHATITTTHSDLVGGYWLVGGSNAAITTAGGDLNSPPLFVNPAAGDYREAPGSPTIDVGASDPLNGPLDFQGDPRIIGTTDIGADEFMLPPTAATGPATAIAAHSATLTGSVNAQGAPTSYRFQYGTSTAYGTTTNASSADAGAASVAAAAAISGLNPSTTYHFRVRATNAAGVSYGADHTFTTTSAPPTPTPTPTPSTGFAGVKLLSTKLTIAHGFTTAWLKCPATTTGHCTGRAKLTIRHSRTRSHAAYTIRLGHVTFAIAAGEQIKIKIRASRAARTLLNSVRRRKGTATIHAHDTAGQYKTTTAAVTIKRSLS